MGDFKNKKNKKELKMKEFFTLWTNKGVLYSRDDKKHKLQTVTYKRANSFLKYRINEILKMLNTGDVFTIEKQTKDKTDNVAFFQVLSDNCYVSISKKS